MKTLVILVLAVVAMMLAGWISIQRSANKTTVTIENETIQRDTERMADQVQDFAKPRSETDVRRANEID